MLTLFFVAFSWPWWLLIGGVSAGLLYSLYDDQESEPNLSGAGVLTLALFAALILLGDFRPWELSGAALKTLAILAICYAVIGSVWAGFFWFGPFLNRRKREYEARRAHWLFDRSLPASALADEARLEEFRRYLKEFNVRTSTGRVWPYTNEAGELCLWPRWKENKARVFRWWAWWPWSATSYLVCDFVVDIFNHIFTAVSSAMDGFSRRRFAALDAELQAAPTKPTGDASKV